MTYREDFFYALNKVDVSGLESYGDDIARLSAVFFEIKRGKCKVYFVGNGGSAGIAIHMTADYLKNGGMRTHSMHDAATLTCLGNDFGYEYVFSKQLEVVADKGDLLVAISSSGNSQNIVNAVVTAKEKDCKVVTFTGFHSNNKLRQMGDYNVYVPSMSYGIVESIHNMILQQIVDELVEKKDKGMQSK
jgi:D-sedoheptulose 7-phosphate isomerase